MPSGYIHHRMNLGTAAEPCPLVDARASESVAAGIVGIRPAGENIPKAGGRCAQTAGNAYRIARHGVRATFDRPSRAAPQRHDVDRNAALGRCRIAADQSHAPTLRDIVVAAHELLCPRARSIARQRQAQQRGRGSSTHGSHVAQIYQQRLASQFVRRRGVAQEMNILHEHVGRDHERLAPADADTGAVVAYRIESAARYIGEKTRDGGYESEFGIGHCLMFYLQKYAKRRIEKLFDLMLAFFIINRNFE